MLDPAGKSWSIKLRNRCRRSALFFDASTSQRACMVGKTTSAEQKEKKVERAWNEKDDKN